MAYCTHPCTMASPHSRSSSSFPNLLLSALNFIVFILSSASLLPIFILRMPPTAFGWALFTASALSLLSSFLGFFSRLSHCCFTTHACFLIASLIAQALGFLALFWREAQSIQAVSSLRNPRQAKILIKIDCGAFLSMFLLQLVVLVLVCTVDGCWDKEYKVPELEKAEIARKRGRRIARIQVESMINAATIADEEAKELDEKMKSKTWSEQ